MKPDYRSPDPPSDSASQIAALSPEKRALLNLKLKQQAPRTSGEQAILRRTDNGTAPLSFAQLRLWFLNQLIPDSPVYNVYRAWRLRGGLDVEALQRAIDTIVARHAVLRSVFRIADGQPIQVTVAVPNVHLSIVDLQGFPPAERETEGIRVVRREARLTFDLTKGPLFRVKLLRLADEDQILFLTLHHIVTDGWSQGVLHRELATLYDAFADGKTSPLSDLPIQYSDYALWQRELLQSDHLEKEKTYWKQQLASLSVLELPTDRPRLPLQSHQGARVAFQLSATLTAQLKVVGQREGATLFMTLLAAVKALLFRYTGQVDIVVGSPIANRTRVEFEPLIGMFVNSLVLRTDVSGDPSFRELLGRVRDMALRAYAHQYLPFEKLVEELRPKRDMSRNPLFQVAFAWQNTPDQALSLSGLSVTRFTTGSVSPFNTGNDTAKFDLTVSMVETDGSVEGMLEYSTDLFDSVTIRRMAYHLQILLEGIVSNPEQRLSRLPLLTVTEQHQLVAEWNETATDYPREQSIHKLFEAQVERTPDAVAVEFGQEQLTYQELNRRANQLSHHLQKLGVVPEMLVGIFLERSLEMVVGLLGILKAGGAYLPLDPAYPKQRIALMLADAQVPVLLTESRLAESLPEHAAQVVLLDAGRPLISPLTDETPRREAAEENLAYVIYTSGSTGKPNGVMITHANFCHYVQAIGKALGVTAGDTYLHTASFAFSSSVRQLMTPLTHGAKVVIATSAQIRDPLVLFDVIKRRNVTIIDIVPSYWRNCTYALSGLDEESRASLLDNKLRLILSASEPLLSDLPRGWTFEFKHDARLVNMYGQTETTGIVAVYPILVECDERINIVSIGRPIADTGAYILDPNLNQVPVGEAGELYIGGKGLARGYLNRPELTAEKFIPHPYCDEPGARLYRTGDMARYSPDGNLEFLGRSDQQMKIRGFRIQPGEVEAVLGQHAGVVEAVVVAREDVPGNRRLVAYVVLNQKGAPTPSELRSFVKRKLPDYMVPGDFVVLEALPLTPNGKVDRRALPAPDHAFGLEETLVALSTTVEQELAGIWAEVLGIKQVGIHENFFELGGDSILGGQIIARANLAGLRFTPQQLFERQTVAKLAAVVGTAPAVQAEQQAVSGPVPLTPIQNWFFEQNLPDPHHFNQAILLDVRQALSPSLIEQVVQYLLTHHDALRLRFVHEESGWRQVIASTEVNSIFSCVDLSALPEVEKESDSERVTTGPRASIDLAEGHRRRVPRSAREAAMEEEAAKLQVSLNLSEGPLVRIALFHFGDGRPSRLLLIIHHLAVDGISWRILLEDLQTGYQQLSQGEMIKLPPKTTSFKYWAARVTEHAQSEILEQELSYWLAEPRTRISRLPVDYPEGVNTRASTRTVPVIFGAEETRVLLYEVPAAYQTHINDVLLTALAQAFAHWAGVRSLLVDLEGHGREGIVEGVDLSRTAGWFTSIFPVLLDLGETSTQGEALKSIKEQLRNVPNRGVGYGLLRYLSENQASTQKLKALPQPEVRFNYLGQFDQVLPQSSSFGLAGESSGPARSLRGNRRYLVDVNGLIEGGQLQLFWAYGENVHRRVTIERLVRDFQQALRSLIAHCRSPEARGYTPSDFPKAKLSQEDLDKFIIRISQADEGAAR